MKVEREALVIFLLIALVLAPTWYFALASAVPEHPVVLNGSRSAIAPTERFLPTPAGVNEFVAGVTTWLALAALVSMVYYTHRFIRVVGRSTESVAGDEEAELELPPWLPSPSHRIAEYWPAQLSSPGLIGLALMSWSTVTFSALFGYEALTYARVQFLGIYGGMAALSLGVVIAIYAAWFMPNVVVVEDRSPREAFAGPPDGDEGPPVTDGGDEQPRATGPEGPR